ncbi:MAG: hypothetical protein JSS65_01065 [Armatimonadetes bacterium]|nr:hypothetical protein [Armatimonadota bacterium]
MLAAWGFLANCALCLNVQTGIVDMTPPEPLPLGGYTARKGALSQPGGDHLYARAVVLSQGRKKLAVVSFETLTIPESLVDEVRANIPKGIDLCLVATHTHCAPDSQMLNKRMTLSVPGISNYQRKWLDWTAGRLSGLVRDTLRRPSESVDGLAIRQAFVTLNRARRKGAHPDPTFTMLSAGRRDLLASFAAHATVYDEHRLQPSGDWPGAFSALTGAAFLPGAIGDMSPNVDNSKPGSAITQLVCKARSALQTSRPRSITGILRIIKQPVRLDPATPSPAFMSENNVPEVLAKVMVTKFAPPTATVTAWSLGKLAVVGVPGEPTAAVSRRIEAAGRAAGFATTLVISHCNGWCGYILEADDYARGGYEATLSFNGPNTAERVVEACGLALNKLN